MVVPPIAHAKGKVTHYYHWVVEEKWVERWVAGAVAAPNKTQLNLNLSQSLSGGNTAD